MTGTIWDSANKSGSITLGRNSLIATTNASNGTWKGVRGTTSHSTGKWYIEYTTGLISNNGWIAGFGNSSFNTASYPGSDSASIGFQTQGSFYGLTGGTFQAFAKMGETIQIAIDLDAKKVWARTDRSTNWNNDVIGNQNPATGTGGKTYTTTGALFPAWGGNGDGTAATQNACTINAGEFTTGTIPSGFSAWDTTAVTGTGIGGTSNPTTWGTKNANVTLSNNNLTATQSSASSTWCSVRTTSTYNSGRLYWEITISAYDSNNGIIAGVADSTFAVSTNANYPGVDGHGTGAAVGFTGWYFNGATGAQPGTSAFAVSHVMGFAADVDRGLIWVKDITAAGNWNNDASADPATGIRGAYLGTPNDIYIAVGQFRNAGTTDAVIINAGASAFSGTKPSGFSAWDVGSIATSASESASAADTVSAIKGYVVTISESATATTTQASAMPTLTVSETLSATATQSNTFTVNRSVADTLSAADTVSEELDSETFQLRGGRYGIVMHATSWGTVYLEKLGGDKITYIQIATYTQDGVTSLSVPPGTYRFAFSGTVGAFTDIARQRGG